MVRFEDTEMLEGLGVVRDMILTFQFALLYSLKRRPNTSLLPTASAREGTAWLLLRTAPARFRTTRLRFRLR